MSIFLARASHVTILENDSVPRSKWPLILDSVGTIMRCRYFSPNSITSMVTITSIHRFVIVAKVNRRYYRVCWRQSVSTFFGQQEVYFRPPWLHKYYEGLSTFAPTDLLWPTTTFPTFVNFCKANNRHESYDKFVKKYLGHLHIQTNLSSILFYKRVPFFSFLLKIINE